jgi:hypothetical protein
MVPTRPLSDRLLCVSEAELVHGVLILADTEVLLGVLGESDAAVAVRLATVGVSTQLGGLDRRVSVDDGLGHGSLSALGHGVSVVEEPPLPDLVESVLGHLQARADLAAVLEERELRAGDFLVNFEVIHTGLRLHEGAPLPQSVQAIERPDEDARKLSSDLGVQVAVLTADEALIEL